MVQGKKAILVDFSGRLGTCLSSQHRKIEALATHPTSTAPVIMMVSGEVGSQSVMEAGISTKPISFGNV